MKIAVFTDGYEPYISGVSTAVVHQTQRLKELGHSVKIFSPYPQTYKGETDQSPEHHQMVISIRWASVPNLWLGLPTFINSLLLVKKFSPDIIHLHTEGPSGLEGLICGYLLNIPCIGTFSTLFAHPSYLASYKLPTKRFFSMMVWRYQKWFFKKCDLTLCPSHTTKNLLIQNGFETNTHVLSYGIKVSRNKCFQTKEELREIYNCKNSLNLIYIGRIAKEKGIANLLEVFESLCLKFQNLRFIIIGEGNFATNLTSHIEKSKYKHQYIYLGAIPNRELIEMGLYRLGDIFVTASETETEGIAMREAMSFGLPVVTVNANAAMETVLHGNNGFLAQPNDVLEMIDLCQKILINPKLLNQLSCNAIKSSQEYKNEVVVDKLIACYQSVIKQSEIYKKKYYEQSY